MEHMVHTRRDVQLVRCSTHNTVLTEYVRKHKHKHAVCMTVAVFTRDTVSCKAYYDMQLVEVVRVMLWTARDMMHVKAVYSCVNSYRA